MRKDLFSGTPSPFFPACVLSRRISRDEAATCDQRTRPHISLFVTMRGFGRGAPLLRYATATMHAVRAF